MDSEIRSKMRLFPLGGLCTTESPCAHEWGHGYGLGHAEPYSKHRQLTMSPAITECSTFQRTLGRGDWSGMYNIYGLR